MLKNYSLHVREYFFRQLAAVTNGEHIHLLGPTDDTGLPQHQPAIQHQVGLSPYLQYGTCRYSTTQQIKLPHHTATLWGK